MPSATAPVSPRAVRVEHLDRHDLRLRRDADHAAPVGRRGDDAGDVRPVAVAVREVLPGGHGRQIDAVDVVGEAVLVVVGSIAGDLAEVRPGVRRQVRVIELGAAVEHGDGDAGAL